MHLWGWVTRKGVTIWSPLTKQAEKHFCQFRCLNWPIMDKKVSICKKRPILKFEQNVWFCLTKLGEVKKSVSEITFHTQKLDNGAIPEIFVYLNSIFLDLFLLFRLVNVYHSQKSYCLKSSDFLDCRGVYISINYAVLHEIACSLQCIVSWQALLDSDYKENLTLVYLHALISNKPMITNFMMFAMQQVSQWSNIVWSQW